MKIVRSVHNLPKQLHGCVATLGNFDGIHLGHQALLKELKGIAQDLKLPMVVIIFKPQPKEFFAKEKKVIRLMRFREKCCSFADYGVDYLLCMRFNQELASLSADDFVEKILVHTLGVKVVVVGDDCHFGAKRAGDYRLLKQLGKKFGFNAIQMPSVFYEDQRVSSTRIKELLQAGNLLMVRKLLGRPYHLWGKVVSGAGRGRTLGFPTANINLHQSHLPLSGIFVVRVHLDGKSYQGVASLGIRPTFGRGHLLLEVYLFDFSEAIYGRYLRVEFLHKLREEAYFDSVDALVEQMHRDVDAAKIYFKSIA